jgi:hypothetical protein
LYPIAALKRVARRHGGEGIGGGDVFHVHLADRAGFIHQLLCRLVLGLLQLTEHHVVHGMQGV